MVEVLLDGGMSVDGRDQSGATPLHWAAGYGCTECITLLPAAGAEVNAARKGGGTPLHRACAAAATLLLAAGGDVRADLFGRVPLHTAFEAIPSLLPAGVNALDDHGMTPLHLAALAGNIDQVEVLLTQGADPARQGTEPFNCNGDEPPESWEPRRLLPVRMLAYDIAKCGHERTTWSTGRYRPLLEQLDALTPRRGLFPR